jgi:hypothetical protein
VSSSMVLDFGVLAMFPDLFPSYKFSSGGGAPTWGQSEPASSSSPSMVGSLLRSRSGSCEEAHRSLDGWEEAGGREVTSSVLWSSAVMSCTSSRT